MQKDFSIVVLRLARLVSFRFLVFSFVLASLLGFCFLVLRHLYFFVRVLVFCVLTPALTHLHNDFNPVLQHRQGFCHTKFFL